MKPVYDVIIIGAGAAGLMAAHEITAAGKSVAIVEARNRIGGRIHTFMPPGFSLPVEAGAEFIHGKLKTTFSLAKQSGAEILTVEGKMWQHKDGTIHPQDEFIEDYSYLQEQIEKVSSDISFADFMAQYLSGKKHEALRFTLKNYVEGYNAADINKASTLALRKELSSGSDDQYRIKNGYQQLVNYLHQECISGRADIFLSQPVQEVSWEKNAVILKTSDDVFIGKKLLVTVPVGVLQHQKISFSPALPEHVNAAQQLGYGDVIKIVLEFQAPFWKTRSRKKQLDDLLFVFSDERIPTWWTQFPQQTAVLTGWVGGPNASAHAALSDTQLLELALHSLTKIFSMSRDQLLAVLKTSAVFNWRNDPFSCGAYSYDVLQGDAAKKILSGPVFNTIFFAGEALHFGSETGTVESALISGRETARHIMASY